MKKGHDCLQEFKVQHYFYSKYSKSITLGFYAIAFNGIYQTSNIL